jgi:hypothetical protein
MAGVHEAEQRLWGQDGRDFVTRMCSRFWMGSSDLPRKHFLVRVEGSVPWRPRIDLRWEPAKGLG